MNISILLKTLLSYLIIGVVSLIFLPPLLLIACLPEKWRHDNRVFYFLLDCWYKLVLLSSLYPLKIIGRENLPKGPAIFVGNHQSSIDIPLMGALCNGYPQMWLVHSFYVDAPILGFFVRRMFVSVEREDPAKAARSLIKILRAVKEKKRHLLIFPEGGRFNDGTIHPFFEGFAVIAQKTGRPVIPVLMPYNGAIYPPASFYIYHRPIVAIIGKSFIMQDDETMNEFSQRIYQWFVEQYERYK